MQRKTAVNLPDLKGYGKTAMKEQIERHYKCFICEFKNNCSNEAKKKRRCIPRGIAQAIINAIDFAVDSVREEEKNRF